MKFLIFFGLVALAQTQTYSDTTKTASSFCKTNVCPKGITSIACSFTNSTAFQCGSDGETLLFNKDAIVKKHNDYRQKLASGGYFPLYLTASRMVELQYSDELAQMALYNTKRCLNQIDLCCSTKTFPTSGQNIAITSWFDGIDIDKTIAQLIDTWFTEYKLGNMSQIKNLLDVVNIGHFAQMAQEKNTNIGCAVASFTYSGKKSLYLVCNYAYGNSSPVYSTGTAASKCTKASSNYKALCSVY